MASLKKSPMFLLLQFLKIKLHKLPMQHRVQFKLLLLIYKPLHDFAPSHLTDKLAFRTKRDSNPVIGYFWMAEFAPLGLYFMPITFSLLRSPHSGMHYLRTFYRVAPPPLAALRMVFKHIFLRKLTRCDCVPIDTFHIWFDSTIYIEFLLYHFIVSIMSATSHDKMLYLNVIAHLCISYNTVLYVVFVFYE